MPLRLHPRVVVVAHLHEVEAGLLGQHGLPDELLGPEPLGGELVTDPHVIPSTAASFILAARPTTRA